MHVKTQFKYTRPNSQLVWNLALCHVNTPLMSRPFLCRKPQFKSVLPPSEAGKCRWKDDKQWKIYSNCSPRDIGPGPDLSHPKDYFSLTVVSKPLKTTALLTRALLACVSQLAVRLHGVSAGDAAASLTLDPFLKWYTFYFRATTTFYMCASGKIDPTCHVPPSSSAVLRCPCIVHHGYIFSSAESSSCTVMSAEKILHMLRKS